MMIWCWNNVENAGYHWKDRWTRMMIWWWYTMIYDFGWADDSMMRRSWSLLKMMRCICWRHTCWRRRLRRWQHDDNVDDRWQSAKGRMMIWWRLFMLDDDDDDGIPGWSKDERRNDSGYDCPVMTWWYDDMMILRLWSWSWWEKASKRIEDDGGWNDGIIAMMMAGDGLTRIWLHMTTMNIDVAEYVDPTIILMMIRIA